MTDLSVRSMDLVLDLINQDNDLDLSLDQVSLTPPSMPEPDIAVTQMQVVALPSFEYSGSVMVTYNRLQLSEVISLAGGIGVLTERTASFAEFVASISELYNLNFGTDELEPVGVFDLNKGLDKQTVAVRAKDASFAYFGPGEFTAYFNYIPFPVERIEAAVARLGRSINQGLYGIFNTPVN